MNRSKEWLAPLTGVAFVVVGIIGFSISGEPKSADDPVKEIVDFYVDKKDSVQIGAIAGVVAGLLLIFFGAYLRKVLRGAAGEGETLSLVSFIGFVLVALGFAIDGTISFALAEAAEVDDLRDSHLSRGTAEVRRGPGVALGEVDARSTSHRVDEVIGDSDAAERGTESRRLEHIAAHELSAALPEPGGLVGVSRQTPHGSLAVEQRMGELPADVARRPRDEDRARLSHRARR